MLPGRGDAPLLSDDPVSGDEVTSVPVEIPTLSIPLAHLSSLFSQVDTLHDAGTGCRDSIAFFRYACGFAREFISRQQFVPASG